MKLTVNRNSWHYKLALYGGMRDWYDQTDLCQYFWALMRGLVKAPLLVAAGVLVGGAMVLLPIAWIAAWVAVGVMPEPLGAELIGLGLWLVLGFIVVAAGIEDGHIAVPGGDLAGAAYRGWKEKTCVLVDIK